MFIIRNSGVPVWVLVATIFVCGCPQAGEERTDNGTANDGQVQNGDDGTQGGNGSAGDQPIHVDGPVSLGDPGAPRIFFSDLISGPSHGGYNDAGAIVTLYGNGFGDQRGSATVTIGGGQAAAYLAWSNTRIAVQIGPQASSGDIIVHCGAGDSNGLPFTVRDGRVLFVAVGGDALGSGAFDQPWASLPRAVEAATAGDIIYATDGVSAVAEHSADAALVLETDGTAEMPIALVAFPGATVTIGDSTTLQYGLRVVPPAGVHTSYWVIAGLRLRGLTSALDLGGAGAIGWRVVGNDISCPNGDGQTGCFAAAMVSHFRFLGNEVHDTGVVGASKQYHAVYFTTDSVHIDVGWNHIHDNNTCRAIQFHSSPLCLPACGPGDTTGFNQYDLIVHDNVIHGDACDGIVFATVDPSQGPVEAFNNVIYDVGRGPDPPDGAANYAGIYVPGYVNTGAEGRGTVEVYNNTLYDCGARGTLAAGALARGEYSPGLILRLRNNIVVQPAGRAYLSEESHAELITGEHNLWFGVGPAPAFLAANIDADPRFVDLLNFDFRLASDSPALDSGVDTGLRWDIVGARRPAHAALDLGAFER